MFIGKRNQLIFAMCVYIFKEKTHNSRNEKISGRVHKNINICLNSSTIRLKKSKLKVKNDFKSKNAGIDSGNL